MSYFLGKLRINTFYLFWNVINLTRMRICKATIGKNVRTRGRIRLRINGRLNIGDNVVINSSIMSNPLGGTPCSIIVVQKGACVEIGNNSGISNSTIFAADFIKIGNNVLLGAGVKIYDNDFHPIEIKGRLLKNHPKKLPIVICDGAFIGAQSIILKGITIGKNSVIGAGSVVTKDIPDNQIWAGNPARFIRNL